MNLSFFIARRYLLKQKGTFSSFIIKLAIAATAISVATMIVALAFVSGFKYEVREKLFSFWGHIHIEPRSINNSSIITPDPILRDTKLERQIKNTQHITAVVPIAIRPAIINANQIMEGISLKGVTADYHLPKNVDVSGREIDFNDTTYSKEIMISEATAKKMLLKRGDNVQICFVEPGGGSPRIRKVSVAGIYHTGMEEIDKSYALCDLRLLQRINNWQPDEINGYQITVDDERLADTLSWQIFNNYIQPPLTTYTMMDIFPNIFDWLNLQDVNAEVIIAIMAIVAVINLAVALLILIVEQMRMIGILKAQGISRSGLQKIFLYHAALISGIGVIAGNVIALGLYFLQKQTGFLKLTEEMYSMKHVPVRLIWWQPVLIDIVTILLCILCMWLPSLYIRRIQPAKVLQFK
ncbi:MAG: ABC transporter permease [Bacteroidetes bacterium]|nr:ABC transporter permease [Bacteroidota bacterium]